MNSLEKLAKKSLKCESFGYLLDEYLKLTQFIAQDMREIGNQALNILSQHIIPAAGGFLLQKLYGPLLTQLSNKQDKQLRSNALVLLGVISARFGNLLKGAQSKLLEAFLQNSDDIDGTIRKKALTSLLQFLPMLEQPILDNFIRSALDTVEHPKTQLQQKLRLTMLGTAAFVFF